MLYLKANKTKPTKTLKFILCPKDFSKQGAVPAPKAFPAPNSGILLSITSVLRHRPFNVMLFLQERRRTLLLLQK